MTSHLYVTNTGRVHPYYNMYGPYFPPCLSLRVANSNLISYSSHFHFSCTSALLVLTFGMHGSAEPSSFPTCGLLFSLDKKYENCVIRTLNLLGSKGNLTDELDHLTMLPKVLIHFQTLEAVKI